MFGFFKKVFLTGLTILSSFTNVNSSSCISMNNEECKVRQIFNVNSNDPVFFFLKQVNAAVFVTILMIHM